MYVQSSNYISEGLYPVTQPAYVLLDGLQYWGLPTSPPAPFLRSLITLKRLYFLHEALLCFLYTVFFYLFWRMYLFIFYVFFFSSIVRLNNLLKLMILFSMRGEHFFFILFYLWMFLFRYKEKYIFRNFFSIIQKWYDIKYIISILVWRCNSWV